MSAGGPVRCSALLCAAVAGVLLVTGCGTKGAGTSSAGAKAAGTGSGHSALRAALPTLATSVSSTGGTGWAIVQMGGPAATFNDFWELFVRPAGAADWKLATPAGVVSNGGMVMTASGATSLVTGFRPSQRLTFSPLAATADSGAQWTQNALLDPGLGNVPDALAGATGGRLIALTSTGDVEASSNLGATWSKLTSQRSLGGSQAGRRCGLLALTAAAWTPAVTPLVAASCTEPGVAGIFTYSAGTWRLSGPTLPPALSRDGVDVIGLATTGERTTAILTVRSGASPVVLAAWSSDGGSSWRLSPALAAGAGPTSISIWADGSAGLVLSGTRGATIGWQAAGWKVLPALPAGTATLAAAADGQPQALAVGPTTMTTWQLAAGSSRWTPIQAVQVQIPYGSSG